MVHYVKTYFGFSLICILKITITVMYSFLLSSVGDCAAKAELYVEKCVDDLSKLPVSTMTILGIRLIFLVKAIKGC